MAICIAYSKVNEEESHRGFEIPRPVFPLLRVESMMMMTLLCCIPSIPISIINP